MTESIRSVVAPSLHQSPSLQEKLCTELTTETNAFFLCVKKLV